MISLGGHLVSAQLRRISIAPLHAVLGFVQQRPTGLSALNNLVPNIGTGFALTNASDFVAWKRALEFVIDVHFLAFAQVVGALPLQLALRLLQFRLKLLLLIKVRTRLFAKGLVFVLDHNLPDLRTFKRNRLREFIHMSTLNVCKLLRERCFLSLSLSLLGLGLL